MKANFSSVDYENIFTPSAVYAEIKISVPQNASLESEQNVQWVGAECSTLEYQIYGPENASLSLHLLSLPGNAPTIVEIYLLPCVIGFKLMTDKCTCSDFFISSRHTVHAEVKRRKEVDRCMGTILMEFLLFQLTYPLAH